ncbi:unnamed protein product [Dibothriocephalus latus]|uniref:Uncharacterized protein n=1 Tax=Dibothriocephalus latus TaxID=60516 RepID=A0A3P7LDQ4_DIBLA|nr:unnamed protein product [Dibothriocephalus latus]
MSDLGGRALPPQNVKKHLSVEAEALHLGPLVSFQGRITCVAVFNEALPEDYVKWVVQGELVALPISTLSLSRPPSLLSQGVNNCNLITDMFLQSNSLSLLFFYHAKAVDGAGQVCLDLAKSGVGRVANTAQTLPPASGDSVSNISPEDSTVANSCLTALEFPAHLIGPCQLTSTAFVVSLVFCSVLTTIYAAAAISSLQASFLITYLRSLYRPSRAFLCASAP